MVHINPAALAAYNAASARAFDKTSDEVDEVNILRGKQEPTSTDESSKAPTASTFVSTDDAQFRQYENASDRVKRFYAEQHARQTVEFNVAVRELFERTRGERARMGVWDALELLGTLVDESDPDTELTQIEHALQTAEAMRRDNQPEYMQAVGLVHDLGKLLFFFNFPGGEFQTGANATPAPSQQWSVVGDTFPVGCAFSPSIVLAKDTFAANPDSTDPRYTSECGIYEPGCGIDNVMMSWGHDEYLYRVLKDRCELPEEGLAMIRYHSFYPWHRDGAYSHLMKPSDEKLLRAVRAFNPYDLYSKADAAPDAEALREYYQALVARWFPQDLDW